MTPDEAKEYRGQIVMNSEEVGFIKSIHILVSRADIAIAPLNRKYSFRR